MLTKLAGAGGEHVVTEIFTTTVPQEVLDPHKRNSFAVADGTATDEKRLSVIGFEPEAERSQSVIDADLYPPPTEEDRATLRKVADSIPPISFSLCIVEFAERASYYGCQTIFSNFMQYPLPKGKYGSLKSSSITDFAVQAVMEPAHLLLALKRLLEPLVRACNFRPPLSSCSPSWHT